jgi:hypothetical protein
MPIATPTATNNATIIAMITTKVSVIEVRRRVYARSLENHIPYKYYMEGFKRVSVAAISRQAVAPAAE